MTKDINHGFKTTVIEDHRRDNIVNQVRALIEEAERPNRINNINDLNDFLQNIPQAIITHINGFENRIRETVFLRAAGRGNIDLMNDLIVINPNIIIVADQYNRTALYHAVTSWMMASRMLEVVQFILNNVPEENRVDFVNQAFRGGEYTALYLLEERRNEGNNSAYDEIIALLTDNAMVHALEEEDDSGDSELEEEDDDGDSESEKEGNDYREGDLVIVNGVEHRVVEINGRQVMVPVYIEDEESEDEDSRDEAGRLKRKNLEEREAYVKKYKEGGDDDDDDRGSSPFGGKTLSGVTKALGGNFPKEAEREKQETSSSSKNAEAKDDIIVNDLETYDAQAYFTTAIVVVMAVSIASELNDFIDSNMISDLSGVMPNFWDSSLIVL